MTKQPLKQYLENLVAYNKTHAVSTTFTLIQSFSFKHTLIKRVRNSNFNIPMDTLLLWKTFNRYMNDSNWKF